jgi:hypothetical protein
MGEWRGMGMTRTVSRAILTTVAVLLFVAGIGGLTIRDTVAAAVMLYPFAHLFCKYVID